MVNLGSSPSQWDNLLKNLGAWQGSFTRLSPQGAVREDTPTLVTLAAIAEGQTIRQTIQRFAATGELASEKVLEYSSLNRSVLFFEDGAFSQGSLQFSPFGEFGAELGFIQANHRLRLVQLFTEGNLSSLTLIREHRQQSPASERPPLTVDQLLGEWQGEAVTLYPDWRSPERYPTHLTLQEQQGQLTQRLVTPHLNFTSTATVAGPTLQFSGTVPLQVLLLADGASATTPLQIPKDRPFFLEAGWLINDRLRQRMIRSYDARGGWSSLTLVTERRAN